MHHLKREKPLDKLTAEELIDWFEVVATQSFELDMTDELAKTRAELSRRLSPARSTPSVPIDPGKIRGQLGQ